MTPVPDDVALDLHHRFTRGQQLTSDERAMVEQWYACQDSAKSAMLGAANGAELIGRLLEQPSEVLISGEDVSTRTAGIVAETTRSGARTLRCHVGQPSGCRQSPCDCLRNRSGKRLLPGGDSGGAR